MRVASASGVSRLHPFLLGRMYKAQYAILIDGGFITKKLYAKLKQHATAEDVMAECERLKTLPQVSDYELLRIYYYDAPPSHEKTNKPVSGTSYNLSATDRFREAQSLHDKLVLKPNVALRMGETRLSPNVWKIKPQVMKKVIRGGHQLVDDDFLLDISQKGVDMRIGLDMARLALREMVRLVIVVTADSDFIPAFKFVRREGVRVIIDTMGHNATVGLKQHADEVL